MKILLILLTLSFSPQAFCLTAEDIQKSLKQMEESGMFSKEQLKAASDKLNSMTPEEREALIKQGKEKVNDPEVQKKAKEMLEKYKAMKKDQASN